MLIDVGCLYGKVGLFYLPLERDYVIAEKELVCYLELDYVTVKRAT
jgi:hypothetical protein